jgi:molybdopterin/thiamine biosynthesis adenylyltransferase
MDYSRLEAIHWWDREKISNASVMVAGVGAVGNEVAKQLALIGLGRVFLADMDTIEESNLTRSILFSHADIGQTKVHVAGRKLKEINPDIEVNCFPNDVALLGLGAFRKFNVIFCCFDGYLSRFHLNHHLQHVGTPWVDAGINPALELNGQIVSYLPSCDNACYECNKSKKLRSDFYDLTKQLGKWSCRRIGEEAESLGFVPTTPMMGSIIAAMQVSEGLRYILQEEKLPPFPGVNQFIELGGSPRIALRKIRRNPRCPQHPDHLIDETIPLEGIVSTKSTVNEFLDAIAKQVEGTLQVELFYDLVSDAHCEKCEKIYEIHEPLMVFAREDNEKNLCPKCGDPLEAKTFGSVINRSFPYGDRLMVDAGLRQCDIFRVTTSENLIDYDYFELTEDVHSLFQPF